MKEWGRHKTHKLVENDMVFKKKKNSQCKVEIKAEIDLRLIGSFYFAYKDIVVLTQILFYWS